MFTGGATGFEAGFFQQGGIVPGFGPKLAVVHGGETIIPPDRSAAAATPNVEVHISGDITPKRPDMSPKDVIQIVTHEAKHNMGFRKTLKDTNR
jgi:hypothetical protein